MTDREAVDIALDVFHRAEDIVVKAQERYAFAEYACKLASEAEDLDMIAATDDELRNARAALEQAQTALDLSGAEVESAYETMYRNARA